MKTYKTVKEIKADVKDGVLTINDNVTFELSFELEISLNVFGSIIAKNITCENITCGDITCEDITCGDINCRNITCGDINYYAFCCVYGKMKCRTWKYRRENAHTPIVLDGKIETATAGEGNE